MAQLLYNGYNVGTDLTSVIMQVQGGGSIPIELLGHITEFSVTQEMTKTVSTPVSYGGKRIHRNIYHDFAGEINLDRFNGAMTNLINGIAQRFQTLGEETYFSILAQIQNTTAGVQGVDEWLFCQCVIGDHHVGRFGGTSKVDGMRFAFMCQALTITGTSNDVLGSLLPST